MGQGMTWVPSCLPAGVHTLHIWSSLLQVWELARKGSQAPAPCRPPHGHHPHQCRVRERRTGGAEAAWRAPGLPPMEGPRPRSLCLRGSRASAARPRSPVAGAPQRAAKASTPTGRRKWTDPGAPRTPRVSHHPHPPPPRSGA